MPLKMTAIEAKSAWEEIDISSTSRVGITTTRVGGILVCLTDQVEPPVSNGEGAVLVNSADPFYVDDLTTEKLFVKSAAVGSTWFTLTGG